MTEVPMDSRWKPIPFFPGYWISNYGDVFNMKQGCILAQSSTTNGSHIVQMSKNGKRHNKKVLQLLHAAFSEEE